MKEIRKNYRELRKEKYENEVLINDILESKYDGLKCRKSKTNFRSIRNICNILNDQNHINIPLLKHCKTSYYNDIEDTGIINMLSEHMRLCQKLSKLAHENYKYTGKLFTN